MHTQVVNQKKNRMGFAVRSGICAGRTMCFQEVNGVWLPVVDPNNPIPVPTPVPPLTPGVQWLNCKSCVGSNVGPGQLAGATCEVCYM